MVYFYQAEAEDGRFYAIIVGKDKFENDLLIKFGYKELNYVWFHADKYSSGHVYLKLNSDEKELRDVPREVITDCLQLCKSKSIHGNKLAQCTILATPWTNLRKNGSMKPGEVSFKSVRRIQKLECHGRDTKLLNRLDKTRVEILENVESLLHEAKKSKDPEFFTNYIAAHRELLLAQEQDRKVAKKIKKKVALEE
ncbi:LANO_0H02850g1_1 [Lachancea nothofagi CBS 11611]|uniref:LANO_0H02850g1_1 n=1 Tax=Lachancea nothofagi CBS 11611 TaxID=1266666 RepID=A0A1G4KL04_9SACH|nr:LANO_0H02850g1_1 [Lachancea nothofagi CBS 11611]